MCTYVYIIYDMSQIFYKISEKQANRFHIFHATPIFIQSYLHHMFLFHLKKCLIMPQYDQWEFVFCLGAAAITIIVIIIFDEGTGHPVIKGQVFEGNHHSSMILPLCDAASAACEAHAGSVVNAKSI